VHRRHGRITGLEPVAGGGKTHQLHTIGQAKGHIAARYGGEEFVLLLPATPLNSALETAERIRRVIAAQSMPIKVAEPLRITVSIGAALLPGEGAADAAALAAALVQRADQALYAAKQGGRNRVLAAE